MSDPQSRFFNAIRNENATTARAMIDAGTVDVNMPMELPDQGMMTPLEFAISIGDYDICIVLLNARADVAKGCNGDAPLTLACTPRCQASMAFRVNIVHWLLLHGANVNGGYHDGFHVLNDGDSFDTTNPLGSACYYGYLDVVRVLLMHGARKASLTIMLLNAFQNDQFDVYDFLKKSDDWTQLHHLEHMTVPFARRLLNRGDRIDIGTPTVLDRAKELCACPLVNLDFAAYFVLQHGAPWSRVTHRFYPPKIKTLVTPLMRIAFAIRHGKATCKIGSAVRIDGDMAATLADVFERDVIPILMKYYEKNLYELRVLYESSESSSDEDPTGA